MISLQLQESFMLVVQRKMSDLQSNWVIMCCWLLALKSWKLFPFWVTCNFLIDLAENPPFSFVCPIDILPLANLGSSVSPYHEVMRMERRLRSSSEGAGGPRVHGNHRDAVGMEGCSLLKHRNNSSSSKMGSLVGVLNDNVWGVHQGGCLTIQKTIQIN